MNNNIFLNSSILVVWAKKTEVELFNYLSSATKFNLCISQIVLSEFTYYWLAIEGKKAPVTLKRDSTIPLLVTAHSPINLPFWSRATPLFRFICAIWKNTTCFQMMR
jgi:hypothetical protein